MPFKAIVADCFYGDNNALEAVFRERQLPYVLAHRGTVGRGWAPADAAHSFDDAALTFISAFNKVPIVQTQSFLDKAMTPIDGPRTLSLQ